MPIITIYPYQLRWIEDKSRFKIGMWARQVGKTFSTTLEIVDDCIRAEAEGRKTRWVILFWVWIYWNAKPSPPEKFFSVIG